MWQLFLRRPDVLHLHFALPAKRFLGSILGQLVGARVVHTIHSNNFDFNSLANRFAVKLANGIILLNTDIWERFCAQNIENCVLMSPILQHEHRPKAGDLAPLLDQWITGQSSKIAVVYSHDRREINGYDIYGFSFVSKLLPKLQEMGWSVVFLDPFAFYRADELFESDCPNGFLQSSNVNFESLLRRTHAYLRPTASDGNSVAVLEAMASGVPVVASDVAPRPPNVHLYKFRSEEDFLDKLSQIEEPGISGALPYLTSPDEYIDFLKSAT